jgi:signal recognition particle subunit SRP54
VLLGTECGVCGACGVFSLPAFEWGVLCLQIGVMVLEELGGKISAALWNLSASKHIDKAALDAVLKEITNALAQSDVEISLVMKVRANIVKKVNITELAGGIDKRVLIERAVKDELCTLLDGSGEKSIVRPKRGKPYIVLFVGLQVRCILLDDDVCSPMWC